ncbi:phosphatidic acid phosphatase type 2/haloperoxidase [Hypoxylon sp. FL1284]|nr:phosphatidic acid phosphatase type 2/haloperoxidase [Hypoxylon sp. FL1284]
MSDDAVPLASLSLTHVHYDPTDRLSYLCAWLALIPQGLCVAYATLIWATREAEVALMFAGQLACEALNFALKRLIKEERPPRMNGKGYGMPSSHAQFLAYFAVSLALFLLFRHQPNTSPSRRRNGGSGSGSSRSNHSPMSLPERALWSTLALALAAAVAWSRVYLNYHTERQVLVGAAAGAVSAVAWFLVTTAIRRSGLLAWALKNPVARFLRVRDLVVEEDLCQAGWEKWDDKMAALMAEKENSGSKKKR